MMLKMGLSVLKKALAEILKASQHILTDSPNLTGILPSTDSIARDANNADSSVSSYIGAMDQDWTVGWSIFNGRTEFFGNQGTE